MTKRDDGKVAFRNTTGALRNALAPRHRRFAAQGKCLAVPQRAGHVVHVGKSGT